MNNNAQQGAMRLEYLIRDAGSLVRPVSSCGDVMISSVEYDSRRVQRGSVFVAVKGFQSDGHDYVLRAVAAGAAAVVVSADQEEHFRESVHDGVVLIVSDDCRRALSRFSAAMCGFPSRKAVVIGITGTNGKTSTTYMLESVFRKAGYNPGVIGTVNYRWNTTVRPAPNTTPESKDIQDLLREMTDDGIDCVIMEISSHGLELGRANDIDLDAAIFTNLTRDHLDFHHTFEEYFAAKMKIFEILERSMKKNKSAVINTDDPYGIRIFKERGRYRYPFISFGTAHNADYMPVAGSIVNTISGIGYRMQGPGFQRDVVMKVAGRFNVYNSMSAFAAACSLGIADDVIAAGLGEVNTVPGRFDCIDSGEGFSVVVDYAHTDDALEKLLLSARELNPHRLITVFGCGGNRDRTKRPLMGKVATLLSDHVVITSDNPRKEDPKVIIDDILAGITASNYEVEPDRETAIRNAIEKAEKGDLIIIAGKGHEDYQILGTEKIHFDDREIAGKYIQQRVAG
ncbi:MAG TPA: UDP-N-acetylmuramoyl-L-alanyl-D-glutamate--2,6-diaminopimelate ligase [Spirochaetota bacterium]|nr:UDP-N-acetylmuramoyl-L-alanyl-D-glutamate--2,6-diaminopimelate ligase [Spirochaetota bacterium]